MFANQVTRTAIQIRLMRTMAYQITEFEEYPDYFKQGARGEVDTLVFELLVLTAARGPRGPRGGVE